MIPVEIRQAKLEAEIVVLERQAKLLGLNGHPAAQSYALGASHALRHVLHGGKTVSEQLQGHFNVEA